MTKYFAVIENGIVENTIISETIELAEELTGKTCVEYFDSRKAFPGCTYDGEKILRPKDYPSWVLNEDDEWVPPTPQPEETDTHIYLWHEEALSWVGIEKSN